MAKFECPICMGPFQRGQHIVCCTNETCHNVHSQCQRDDKCCLCRSVGMRRNRLLEALFDDGTLASETHDISYGGGIYNGEWKDNHPHGEGRMTFSDSFVYKGQWKSGKRDGQGTLTFSDGNVYRGQWKDGHRHGEGTCTWPRGDVYKGQWKNGLFDGGGTLTFSDGEEYKGHWKNGQRHGEGTQTTSDGDVYKGQWKSGQFDGEGTCTSPNGAVYKGQWKVNVRHGKGTETCPDGKVVNCIFSSSGKLLSRKDLSDSKSQSSTDEVSVLGKRSREDIVNANIQAARTRGEIIDVCD